MSAQQALAKLTARSNKNVRKSLKYLYMAPQVPNMVQEDEMSIRPLSDALRKKAEEELNETPEKILSHLKILRDWIKTQPDLQTIKTKNQWLIAFLRGCKYDLEKAKGKLQMYAKFKATLPDLYGNRDPFDPDIQEILKIGVYVPLRRTMSDDGPRVVISRSGLYSQSQRPVVDFVKVVLMVMEIVLLEDDNLVVAGQDGVNDLQGMSFGFILQCTPSLTKKAMTCIEKTLSIRIKKLQVVHPPFGLQYLMAIMKIFMTSKAKNRIQIHSKDSLYEHVDKSILPEEYGGTDGKLQDLIDHWKEKVESYRDWFLDENVSKEDSVVKP